MKKLLSVKNLRTYFKTFKGVVKAVDGVSFDINEREILGVVGESGGGKSITGFSLIGLIDHPGEIMDGEIIFNNISLREQSDESMRKVRGNEIAMIFQDPMTALNPLYTIGYQIEEVLKAHCDMSETDRKSRIIELLNSVGIPNPEDRIKDYPHQFSGGMRQRVVIAIALAGNPKLIIADEPTTALDVTMQAQILDLLKKLVRENNCSMILISHDLAVISEVTDRVNVMYCGKIVEQGVTKDVINNPVHPYTVGLLKSIPRFDLESDELETIEGMVPSMFDLPQGCNFAPRCKLAVDRCLKLEPEIVMIDKVRSVACFEAFEGR